MANDSTLVEPDGEQHSSVGNRKRTEVKKQYGGNKS